MLTYADESLVLVEGEVTGEPNVPRTNIVSEILTHTHTHAHTHTRTYTHVRTHTHTHILIISELSHYSY